MDPKLKQKALSIKITVKMKIMGDEEVKQKKWEETVLINTRKKKEN